MDWAHTAQAERDRQAKAVALARALYATLTPEQRRELERAAGVRTASDETWSRAAALVGQRLAWDSRHPDRNPT